LECDYLFGFDGSDGGHDALELAEGAGIDLIVVIPRPDPAAG
jgi:translation initiation factor IF-3